jgi:hypothetical protein
MAGAKTSASGLVPYFCTANAAPLTAPGTAIDDQGHTILIEKTVPAEVGVKYPRCIAGERACPPEDCGGAGGYEALLKILNNRKHPEHKAMKEWLGRPFDAELFDDAKTNILLSKLKWPHVTEGQLRKVLMARDGFEQ